MFLKEKHDGSIKVRGCADGYSQRDYMTKNETSSPTVSLEAMMLSCAIDAKEGRCVAVTDIPGDFLHADMDQDIHMLLEGTIAELIVKLDQKLYRKYNGEIRMTNQCYTSNKERSYTAPCRWHCYSGNYSATH